MDTKAFEGPVDPLGNIDNPFSAVKQGQGYVLGDGHGRQQIEILEDEADLASSPAGLLETGQAGYFLAGEPVLALAGTIEQANYIKQGCFTGAAGDP